jgi:CYTH domain-containing protein
MALERRFLIASSLARLIHKERGGATRLVEAHFPARSDRTQLVRVEREHSYLILRTSGDDGQIREEQVEVPLSHAEALVEVAAGTVAFDRIPVPLGGGTEAALDRYIIPRSLDLLTVTITSDPRVFAPLLWFGTEVTGNSAYDPSELALNGMPDLEEVEINNVALEALLDTVEGRSPYGFRSQAPQQSSPSEVQPARPEAPAAEPLGTGDDAPSAVHATVPEAEAVPEESPVEPVRAQEGNAGEVIPSAAAETTIAEVDEQDAPVRLPDVETGPSLRRDEPAAPKRPALRPHIRELDDGIARLARSLAPRAPRQPQ